MDMILLASLGIGAGLALVAFTLLTQAQEKAVVRESLRQLDGYEVENVRDQELLNPLKQRAILPVTQKLTGLGKRFTPVGYVDSTRKKITLSGGGTAPDALDKFLAVRVATVAAIPVVFILVFFISPFEGKMAFGLFG